MVNQQEQQEKQQLEQKESNGTISDSERSRLAELRQKG
jgi:hypothetical protein